MSGLAIFLDRDGIINELSPDPVTGLYESPLSVEEVTLIPGAVEAIDELVEAGFLIVIVTNQPAAAKAKTDLETLGAVHARVLALLAAANIPVDTSRMCIHHPQGSVQPLTMVCECRKPAPGMLIDAAEELDIDLGESWIIGDSDADIQAGIAAGCHDALVAYPLSAHRRSGHVHGDVEADTLAEAVRKLLAEADC